MKKIVTFLKKSQFLSIGIFLTAANILTGLFGYAYQILMGRMLAPVDFALLSTLMALYVILISTLGGIQMYTSRRVTQLAAAFQFSNLDRFFKKNIYSAILFLILLMGFSYFFIEDIVRLLRAPTDSVIIFLALLGIAPFIIVNTAFYQGLQKFNWLVGAALLTVLLKIALSTVFVYNGLEVNGAIGGILLSGLLVFIAGLFLITRAIKNNNENFIQITSKESNKLIISSVIANIGFIVSTQLDMVLVDHFFTREQAGWYAAASVFGKAVFYLPGGIVTALFPIVVANDIKSSGSKHVVKEAILLTAVMCGSMAFIYLAFGFTIVKIFYGVSYLESAELLRWYGFAMLPMALVMIIEHYLIAKGRLLFSWIFMGALPLEFIAIYQWHEELWMILANMSAFGFALMLVGFWMIRDELLQKKIHDRPVH